MNQLCWRLLPKLDAYSVQVVEIEDRRFYVGRASGKSNNCLIDTLRQKLDLDCSLEFVRRHLVIKFPHGEQQVTEGNFLDLRSHWCEVINSLGEAADRPLNADNFSVACIDLTFEGNGDVVGTGPTTLHIAREDGNHFVPLIPCNDLDVTRQKAGLAALRRLENAAADPFEQDATQKRLREAQRERMEVLRGEVIGRLKALGRPVPMNVNKLSPSRLVKLHTDNLPPGFQTDASRDTVALVAPSSAPSDGHDQQTSGHDGGCSLPLVVGRETAPVIREVIAQEQEGCRCEPNNNEVSEESMEHISCHAEPTEVPVATEICDTSPQKRRKLGCSTPFAADALSPASSSACTCHSCPCKCRLRSYAEVEVDCCDACDGRECYRAHPPCNRRGQQPEHRRRLGCSTPLAAATRIASSSSECICQLRPCRCCSRSRDELETNRCDACDRPGCYRAHPQCVLLGRQPEDHPDSQPGDSVPHISQLSWCLLGRSESHGAQVVEIENNQFFVGQASGDGNNCLIDTLRQKLNLTCSTNSVRSLLRQKFRSGAQQVTESNYLDLELHWWDVITYLGQASNRRLDADNFRVVCIDLQYVGHGDVVGTGPETLYIARENATHFVPLIPSYGNPT